ncbi:MAG: OmpA family protein [Thiomicrospira sp.]|uniref:OmpA family protein n=1 Tax=Thiomicrospira sp. TaxID=935 RepID=UPI001A07C662|nr:OmpA family protein [Thiomicrospira sp.]MBE0492992.1 OmpA family protein [Thiomicrospira sp.]
MRLTKIVLTGLLLGSLTACSTMPGVDGSTAEDRRTAEAGLLDRNKQAAEQGVEVLSLSDTQGLQGETLIQGEIGGLLDDEAIRDFSPVIYFGYDQFSVDEKSTKILKHYADQMLENPRLMLKLEGHTDERGSPSYNLALGEKRAKAAAEVMMLYGVSTDRITVISFGEEQPAELGHNEAAWDKNRRVELRFN